MRMFRIILTALIFCSNSYAQFGASINIQSGHASNIFSNYRQLPDFYNDLQADLNYDIISATKGLRLFYSGNATLFETYDYRSYQVHSVGLSYYTYIGEKQSKINVGFNGRIRRHTDEYLWYQYNQGYGYITLKIPFQDQLFGYVGVNFRFRNYEKLSPYSYWRSTSYLRLSRFYNSGTSIIVEFDYMQKQYLHSDASSPLQDFPYMQTDGSGNSRQIVGLLRIAQAVTSKTGLSTQFLIRRNLNSSIRYLINEAGYYYSDEELFDDMFGYQAEQWNMSVKHRLPWKMQLSMGGTYLLKHYFNRLALDLQGYPFEDQRLRDDQRLIGWVSLTKVWQYSKTMKPITFSVDFSAMKNNSNDPYYTFNTHYLTVGISQNF